MGVDVMRPAYNFEPQYRTTMLMREDWTKATRAPPAVKGLVWFTDGSKMREGNGAGVYGQSVGQRLSFSLGRYATVFQAEIYAILACAYEIQSQNRLEKYVSICPDSLAALKTLKAVRTTSPLVHQCQKPLNDISIWHAAGLFWVPGHAGIEGNEIADGLARGGTALRFLGPEPALGISTQDLQKRLGCCLANQHGAQWRGLDDTHRQAREFISGPILGTRAKFMNFNKIQTRVVTGLLTGHNTLRRHLYLLGLLDSPLCRKCRVGEETSAHILCECEALASLRHVHLGSFFLEPEDIRSLGLGAIWNYSKVVGLP